MIIDLDNGPKSAVADKISTIIRYVSYPLGLVTGGLVADVSVRNHLYKNFISRGFFTGDFGAKGKGGVRPQSDVLFQKTIYDNLMEKHKAGQELSSVSKDVIYWYEKANLGTPRTFTSPIVIINEKELETIGGDVSHKVSHLTNNMLRIEIKGFFHDLGISNPIKYWKTINRNQKVEAVVLGFTGAAITIGALLAIADHKGLVARLFPDKDQSSMVSR